MKLSIGDVVKVWTGVCWHYGIFAGEVYGQERFLHNAKGRGVERTDRVGFAGAATIQIVERARPGTGHLVVAGAEKHLGREYDLGRFNCEHFVCWFRTIAIAPIGRA